MTAATTTKVERVIPKVVATILAGRGVAPEAMEAFLYPDYERDLHDPLLLTDMQAAVDRILQAALEGERVAIYGDYDIDGITASAVMIEGLRTLGLDPVSYIPDRFEEGYGINQAALEQLQHEGYTLVISVDCGITSVNEAAWAREHGLDLIITDHHAVPDVIPEAIAVINPKRPEDAYPFKELAGVGVAFKVIQALQVVGGSPLPGQEKWLLDLVALGSVCDIVELVGENRTLVSYGLKVMRRTRRPGLRALAAVGGISIDKITAEQLGFVLGPRMNAAGRLEHAARSVELVMTEDAQRAAEIAAELDTLNAQRRADQARIVSAALEQAAAYADDPVLVLAHEDWSHGIVGIVASKIVERHHKPTLIMQIMGDVTKGSARSVGSFNMVDGLRAVAPHLTKFGGHFYAAGYTLPTAHIEALRAGLNQAFRDGEHQAAERVVAEPELVIEDPAALTLELHRDLSLLEPFGAANKQPLLGVKKVSVQRCDRMGSEKQHYRLTLNGGIEAVGFGLVERLPELKAGIEVDACFRLAINEWQGRSKLQLGLVEVQPVSHPAV